MGVGAAESEGVDPYPQGTIPFRQRPMGRHHFQVEPREVDAGVGCLQMDGRRQGPMLEGKYRLDQAGHARSRFQMAQVALHRTHGQRPRATARLANDLTDGRGLDGVPHRRACAMGLHVIQLIRLDTRLSHHPAQQIGLPFDTGNGDATLAAAIGVGAAGKNHRLDVVTIGLRLRQRL